MFRCGFFFVIVFSVFSISESFVQHSLKAGRFSTKQFQSKFFEVVVPLGDGYQPVKSKFRPLFEESTLFVTQYSVPFSLNVEPDGATKLPVVKKNGKGDS